MNIYIYQHLGLGDMIANNALVRHLIELNNKSKYFKIFCKKMHIETIKFMFRDLKRVQIVPVSNNSELEKRDIKKYIKLSNEDYELIKIGHEFYEPTSKLNPFFNENPWHCTVTFYKQFGFPFKNRFKKFYYKRDLKNEKKLFKRIIKNKNYIFIHDDSERGLLIDTSKIDKKYQIVKNDKNNFIFDYRLILENAKELHVIESSFRQLIENFNIKTKKLFLYKDDRPDYSFSLYNSRSSKFNGTSKNWKEIKFRKMPTKKNYFFKLFK